MRLLAASQVRSFGPGAVHFPDADITFQSIDGVEFKVHKRNLAYFSGGFLTRI
jgi:hypothetical protein